MEPESPVPVFKSALAEQLHRVLTDLLDEQPEDPIICDPAAEVGTWEEV